MNQRLDRILSLIDNGTGIADIGTDHGYIPVKLALSSYTGKIIATDINDAPLKKAIKSADDNSCIDRIDFRLSDGLSSIDPSEIDTVIIAGMGSDLICRILDSADWICSSEFKLILQPMSKTPVLRYWLLNNGFNIFKECYVKQNGKIFNLLESRYSDNCSKYADTDFYTGIINSVPDSEIPLFYENRANLINEYQQLLLSLEKNRDSKKYIYYNKLLNNLMFGDGNG